MTNPSQPLLHQCRRPPIGWRCTRRADHEGPCAALPDEKAIDAFFECPDERPRLRRAVDHLRGPWSRRRAWNLVCAGLAAIPGVRRYVLSTSPLSAHPMFETYERARRLP